MMANPQKNRELNPQDLSGILIALIVIVVWAALFVYSIFFHELTFERFPVTVLLILALTFLNTGLFITAHDAMHGIITPRWPKLNHGVGALCVFLYAGFNYSFMKREHHFHHAHPGVVGQDPDFHGANRASYLAWYLHFFYHYFRWWQLAGILAVAVSMQVFLGAAQWNPLTFWALPGVLSSFQLFTFGTWLPHRNLKIPFADWHRARSNDYPAWLSFLTCYHFGYHWEHHEWPFVPWWKLPRARAMRRMSLSGEKT
jgi:beta-carotene ketolase (CrtW type)